MAHPFYLVRLVKYERIAALFAVKIQIRKSAFSELLICHDIIGKEELADVLKEFIRHAVQLVGKPVYEAELLPLLFIPVNEQPAEVGRFPGCPVAGAGVDLRSLPVDIF